MTISADTIRRWNAEREINERLANTGSKRFRWLRRLYVRVYQFLLSRYLDGGLPPRTSVESCRGDDHQFGSTMPFVDLTSDHRGLQARSPEALRYALEQIHSNQPAKSPASSGERDESHPEWVVVATSQDWQISTCEKVLEDQYIKFRRSSLGFYHAVEVRFEDRHAAFVALRGFPQRHQGLLRRRKKQRAPSVFLSLEDTNPIWLFLILLALLIAVFLSFLIIDEMRSWTGLS